MIKVGVFFGGPSPEHEISLLSAKNIMAAMPEKYQVVPIGIDRHKKYFIFKNTKCFLRAQSAKTISINYKRGQKIKLDNSIYKFIDVAFPVLHGAFGEDGQIQTIFESLALPFVGACARSSKLCMDKIRTKKVLIKNNLKVANFLEITRKNVDFFDIKSKLGLPFFVKPSGAGSSVGVSKVRTEKEFSKALNEAFKYDKKILLEKAMVGREIECAVLGGIVPKVSLPGEVVSRGEFYSYAAKYLDKNGARLIVPAKLTHSQVKIIKNAAKKTFISTGCYGLARVDGFLIEGNKFIVNEINTMPGFTKISMYPKMWELSGIAYPKLLNALIKLALARK